ncbi:hypothetical protein DFH07DRAFT_765347 [Mycena maculata]|uniref:Uncharacterized protein n=1 Tax=Mycena maculata TaxID=230809 RepID=A0AAD7NYE5_9AGAR|nr:hypothetical protein DFH07DRAFT_765347 [Mycena maculata]
MIIDSDAAQGVNELMSALTVSTPGPAASMTLLPHPDLRGMYFGCGMESWIDYMQYAKMLQSHWKIPNSALRATGLLIKDGPRLLLATLIELDDLRQDGLDLSLLEGLKAADVMGSWLYYISFKPYQKAQVDGLGLS